MLQQSSRCRDMATLKLCELVTAINSDHLINLGKQKKMQKASCWLKVNRNCLHDSVSPLDMKDAEITNKELLSTALCAARSKIQVTGDETIKIFNEAKDSSVSAQAAWSRKRLTTFPRTPELFRMKRHGKPEILAFPG